MKPIGIRTIATLVCLFACWLIPSGIKASVEVDGIFYDLNTSAKTAAVASNPDKYTGAIDIPSSFVYNGDTYSVKSISSIAFLGCSEMTSITIPSSVTSIGPSAFERCTGLTDVVIGSGVTLIDYEAFKNCSNLKSLTLPSSLKTIENETFSGCSSLAEIIAKRTTPPTIVSTTFDGVDKTACTVYVPEGCQSTYAKATNWKAFSNIVELTVVASGSCGDNVNYTIYSDMSMIISGTGPMQDFYIGYIGEDEEGEQFNNRENNEVWIQVKKVTIEEGVTTIGDYAFFDCKNLLSVIIPNSVTSIGSFSFKECTNLTTFTIPSSVAVIGDYAFSYSGLTHFIIEDGGEGLLFGSSSSCGIEFFEECPLEYVYMGRNISANNRTDVAMDQLVRWGDVTYPPFSGQSSLKTLIIGDNVTTLEDYSFSGTPLLSLVIGNNVQTIGMYALSSANKGQAITIPSNVTKVGDCCFSPSISQLIIEKGDNDLELYGGTYSTELSFCGNIDETIVESVYVGRNLTYSTYARNRFVSAYIDTELTAIPQEIEYDDEGNVVEVLSYKPSPIEATNIYLENDGSLGRYYFHDCSNIEHIYNMNPSQIGDFAFTNCTGLKTVNFDVNGPTSIRTGVFAECRGLTSLILPDELTSIGSSAFWNCGIRELHVGPTPAQIDESTFFYGPYSDDEEDEQTITRILYVPVGCRSVYQNADYWDCFDNIVEDASNLEILATGSCGDNVTYTIYSNMTMVITGTGPMWNHENEEFWYKKPERYGGYYSEVKKVIIEEGVTSIGNFAFYDFRCLSSLIIPNSVTSIGDLAISYCKELTSITIPNSVTRIDWGVFYGCSSLSSLFIPANVSIIKSGDSIYDLGSVDYGGIFCNCNALTTITVDVNNLYYDTRDGCNAIIETSSNNLIAGCSGTIIPNSVTTIADYAFFCCRGLTSITIPNGVTSIGRDAFSRCTSLTSLTIPNSVTSIDDGAFYGCTGLNSITVEHETPLPIYNETFSSEIKASCILYVPTGSKTSYENAEGWNEFENIVEYGGEPDTDISSLDNAIYVDYTEGRIGGTMDIPVKLKNSYPVRGFLFTMELPEGTTVNSWKLSTNRLPEGATVSDKFSTQKIEGNKITVACSLNYGDATFTDNDGEIATVNVTFANVMEVGEYPIYLRACDISDAGGTDNKLSDIKAALVLEDYVEGDANGDGVVLIGDVIAILNYIVGVTSNNFNEKAADVNGDGEILIGDVIAVLNIIVSQ